MVNLKCFIILYFKSILNIITYNNTIKLDIEIIITDNEQALVNVINKLPSVKKISCYFHYSQNIIKAIKTYGLFINKNKEASKLIIKKLCNLPFLYKGNINFAYNTLDIIKKEFPIYINITNEYFIKYKIKYFNDSSLNYYNLPKDCRTNNPLENYTGFLKRKLGRHKFVNYINFIDFIKKESIR